MDKNQRRQKRKSHIRKSMVGSPAKPRLTVFRSNKHIYAQLIDDVSGVTLASANDLSIKKGTKVEKAEKVGEQLAKNAKKSKIEQAVFDRNGYKFHGRVKAVAEGARAGGLSI